MIAFLTKILNILVTIIQNLISVTSSVGEVIVLIVKSFAVFILKTIKSALLFFQIVYEDNINIFTEDFPNLMKSLNDSVFLQCTYLHNSLSMMVKEVTFKLNIIVNNITWLFGAVFFVIYEVLIQIKKVVTFFGETLWLLFTFVPVHLPELIKACYNYIKDLIVNSAVDTYMSLLKVTNFLSDVPLESFMGILTAIIFVRSCIHFRETIQTQCTNIYWMLVRKTTYLYYATYNYFADSEIRVITRLIRGQAIVPRDVDDLIHEDENGNSADALCVICQERQKCVLTLPCRHVCLCGECCIRLYGYQRKCPICRTFIYHSVNVYL